MTSSVWGGFTPRLNLRLRRFVFVRFVVSVPSHILLLSYLQLPLPLFCFFILLLSVQYVFAEYVVWSGEFWWALVPGGADTYVGETGFVVSGNSVDSACRVARSAASFRQ